MTASKFSNKLKVQPCKMKTSTMSLWMPQKEITRQEKEEWRSKKPVMFNMKIFEEISVANLNIWTLLITLAKIMDASVKLANLIQDQNKKFVNFSKKYQKYFLEENINESRGNGPNGTFRPPIFIEIIKTTL